MTKNPSKSTLLDLWHLNLNCEPNKCGWNKNRIFWKYQISRTPIDYRRKKLQYVSSDHTSLVWFVIHITWIRKYVCTYINVIRSCDLLFMSHDMIWVDWTYITYISHIIDYSYRMDLSSTYIMSYDWLLMLYDMIWVDYSYGSEYD